MNIISLLKKLPIDVGQAKRRHDSAGKLIAFSFVKNVLNKKALDIGCRDGYWSDQLKTRGYTVSSLDLEPNYEFALKYDIEKGLPYEDKSFDLVLCTEVVEHLHYPESLFREIERVLRPKGLVIITTPNSGWWFYKVVFLWGWTPLKLQNSDHKQFFKERDIKNLATGYEVLGYFPYSLFFSQSVLLLGPFRQLLFLFVRFLINSQQAF